MLRLVPCFIRQSSLIITRLASQSSNSHSENEPRVRLHPGNQYTVEEIAQGTTGERKREIEELYEFEKLEINNQPSTRDEYRHNINRSFRLLFLFSKKILNLFLRWRKRCIRFRRYSSNNS